MDRETVELILRDDVQRAKQALALTRGEINSVLEAACHPDGRLYLEKAKPVHDNVWREYMEALTRLWDFLIYGKVPPDMEERADAAGGD